MKIDDNILKQFCLDGQDEMIEKKGMTISEILDFLRSTSQRLITKTNKYFKSDDLLEKEDCLDIIGYRFNDFIQFPFHLPSLPRSTVGLNERRSRCCQTALQRNGKSTPGQEQQIKSNENHACF